MRRMTFALSLLILSLATLTTLPTTNAQPLTWTYVTSPPGISNLTSVFCVSASNCWAVGWEGVIIHWNGVSWASVTSPETSNNLNSVFCVSASNCWAVGDGTGTIIHWNGVSWASVKSPLGVLSLDSVFCLSSSDCWAGGEGGTIIHWNGVSWATVDTSNADPFGNPITSIFCVSIMDCWAVGWYGLMGPKGNEIYHWDGSGWNWYPSPTNNDLNSVFCVSASDCWAVAGGFAGSSGVIHWGATSTGSSWVKVPSPSADFGFDSVFCASSIDCWAVGISNVSGNAIIYWNGVSWASVTSSTTNYILSSVFCVSSIDCWAVGYAGTIIHGTPAITGKTLTVSYVIVGGGTPSAPEFNYVAGGTPESLILTTTPVEVPVDPGSSWSVTNPLPGSSTSEQWVTTQATSGTVVGSGTLVFKYQHQYYLTMQPTPSGTGTVTPRNNWYNAGQKVSIKATAKTGYKFLSWTGSGSGSYSGSSSSVSVTMNAPITETATFGVIITITSNPAGSGYVTVDGVAVKTPQTFVWVVGSTHTIAAVSPVSCGTGCQYVFATWSDGGGRSHTITVPSSPTTYKAAFQKLYLLTTTVKPSGAGSVLPFFFSGWHGAGTKVTLTATANTGHTFKSWTGTGSGSYTGTNNPATITMNSAITETANFT